MDMKQLKYFVEVARREHISDAALELNIAQFAISRQINQLEKELNVILFKRSGRNIILTTEGKQLLSQATQILDQIDKTVQSFQQQSSTDRRTIYVGYEESDVSQMMLPLIQSFEQQSTSIMTPQLMCYKTMMEDLITGVLDIRITELTEEITTESQLQMMPLFEENYHIYVPKDHPIAMSIHPLLSQFETEPLYCLTPFAKSIKNKLKVATKSKVRFLSNKQLAQYVLRQNKGFVIYSQNINLNDNNEWVDIPLIHTELKRTICAVTRFDNKKTDIKLAWNLIYKLINKTTPY